MASVLSSELIEFMKGCVRSVWAVELLLFLRAHKDRAWSADELVAELRSSRTLATEILSCFSAAGLISEPDTDRFVYAPAAPVLEDLCATLEQEYRERPVAVVNAIVAVRNSGIQNLADAFRFKGNDK
jgi:hypothetical protein